MRAETALETAGRQLYWLPLADIVVVDSCIHVIYYYLFPNKGRRLCNLGLKLSERKLV